VCDTDDDCSDKSDEMSVVCGKYLNFINTVWLSELF
jgi:hypothetical protein